MSFIGYRKKSVDSSNTSTYSISSSLSSVKSKTSKYFKRIVHSDKEKRPKLPRINMFVVTEYLALR